MALEAARRVDTARARLVAIVLSKIAFIHIVTGQAISLEATLALTFVRANRVDAFGVNGTFVGPSKAFVLVLKTHRK